MGGEYDFFLARLSGATGDHVWSRSAGGVGIDLAVDLALDATGAVVATGSIASDPGTSFGGAALPFGGTSDVVVARYDGATGAHIASASYGGVGDDVGQGVAVRSSTGDVVLVGYSSGTLDFVDGAKSDPAPYGYFVTSLGRLGP
jgi:hypothetical protein